jgi:hypothetical protein
LEKGEEETKRGEGNESPTHDISKRYETLTLKMQEGSSQRLHVTVSTIILA